MDIEHQHYKAYLVRLWHVGTQHSSIWRASIEEVGSGTRQNFANLEMLYAFLEEATGKEQTELHDTCADQLHQP